MTLTDSVTTHVYHFTDTARLPWIMRSGELRPGANRIGGFPDPDFVWATSLDLGDATCSADRGEHYRSGKTRHVRFTLYADLFVPWSAVPGFYPQWTRDHVERLERAAVGKSRPADWWCRAQPVPLIRCLAIDTRSYRDPIWRPLDREPEVVPLTSDDRDLWLAMEIAGTVFASKTFRSPLGMDAYAVRAARASLTTTS